MLHGVAFCCISGVIVKLGGELPIAIMAHAFLCVKLEFGGVRGTQDLSSLPSELGCRVPIDPETVPKWKLRRRSAAALSTRRPWPPW